MENMVVKARKKQLAPEVLPHAWRLAYELKCTEVTRLESLVHELSELIWRGRP